jgi:hypothetical protein
MMLVVIWLMTGYDGVKLDLQVRAPGQPMLPRVWHGRTLERLQTG